MRRLKPNKSLMAILVITVLLMAAFIPGTIQAGTSTGIWTTNYDGSDQNLMSYDYWEDVYVAGGSLEADSYYIRVTNTSGSETISESVYAVVNTATGAFGPDRLADYLPPFTFESGVYKVWVCPNNGFAPSDSKTDNFTVLYNGSPANYTADLTIEKTFDEDVAWPENGFQFELTHPTGTKESLSITETTNPLVFNDISPGEYVLQELSLPSDWSWEDFDITGAENVSEDTANRMITFTIPEPAGDDVDVTVTVDNEYYDDGEFEATLTIIKEINPDDAVIPGDGFLLSIYQEANYPDDADYEGMITEAGTYIDKMAVSPSTMYTITEDIPAGWTKSFSVEGPGISAGDGWNVDENGILHLWIANNSFRDVNVVVTITNTYEEESEYGDLHVKKIVVGDGPDEEIYDVQLCRPDRIGELYSAQIVDDTYDGCIHLNVEEGINSFNNEDYELQGLYGVSEWGPVTPGHQGYLVYLADSEWKYDDESPIAGDGEADFDAPEGSVPVDIDPYEDTYIVIVNYFEDEPELIVEKRIGSGTSTQKYYSVELQRWECEAVFTNNLNDAVDSSCGWETIDTFKIAVDDPWSKTLYDLYAEYGYGEYRVVETGTDEIRNWKSLSYAINDETIEEASFWVYGEEETDIVVEITNNFKTGGGSDSDTWPRLTIEKEIGEGTATQNSFTVELQKLLDDEWSTEATFSITPGTAKTVYMEQYGAGTYRVVEIDTDDIEGFVSASYSVTGDTTGNEDEFKVVKNGRNSAVVVTNNFKEDEEEEEVIIEETEPAEPIIVPEPAPELPKTGTAPLAAGLGLLLAAGGLAIRSIKK